MDAEEECVVRAVMLGSSSRVTVVVTMEDAVEVTVVVVGAIPGQVEGDRHGEVEQCRSAAV